MRALVFLVIAATVFIQGLSGGMVASALSLRRPSRDGTLILGAHAVARLVARRLKDAGESVLLVDANSDNCMRADTDDLPVVYGNGLEDAVLERAGAASRARVIALTPNESVNFLFAKKVRDHFRGPDIFVALETGTTGVTTAMVAGLDAHLLFAGPRRLNDWLLRLPGEQLVLERWRKDRKIEGSQLLDEAPADAVTPQILYREDEVFPVDERTEAVVGDIIEFAVIRGTKDDVAYAWLKNAGFSPENAQPGAPSESTSISE
jgi:hypothetical protein